MTTDQLLSMHQQHREAQLDVDSWVDDIYMWMAEHKQALAWLSQLQTAIHESDLRLQQHASAVDKLERHIRQHEHEIALQEQRGTEKTDTELSKQHEEFVAEWERLREAHQQMGKQHRKHLADLKRAVDDFKQGLCSA